MTRCIRSSRHAHSALSTSLDLEPIAERFVTVVASRGTGYGHEAVRGRDRCVDKAFELVLPRDDEVISSLALMTIEQLPGTDGPTLRIVQKQLGGIAVDRVDRVQVCVDLVRRLHLAGLNRPGAKY